MFEFFEWLSVFISNFFKTQTGQNLIRVVFNTFGVSGAYLLIMSLVSEIVKFENNQRRKARIKLIAKSISIIIGIAITFLISIFFYNINSKKLLIGQSMIFYFVSITLFIIITSQKLIAGISAILKALKRK